MSSRKKPKPAPTAPPPQGLQLKPPTVRLWMIVICLGVLAGVLAGVIAYFIYPTGISVGTFNTTMPAPVAAALSDQQLFATYAGAAACRECHAREYELWSSSHHGLAERSPDPALDKAAFDPPRAFEHGSQKTQVRVNNGKYEIITAGYERAPTAYPVARVIGVDPLRQFLTATPGGRLQTLEASYDPHKNQWFNVYGNEDRHFGEWGHWTGRGMNWNSMCASCHNTRVRKNYDQRSDSYQTTMAQLTVSCESCHGPMKSHANRQKSYAGGGHPPASQPSSYKFSKDQTLDTCATCHARRADLTGDFVPGDAFHDHHSLTIPDLTDLFYPDGQVREEDYEFTAFLGSKMHAAGVRCGDCHDPHSSKPLFAGNALCMRCHNGSFKGSPIIVPEQHSFHRPDSTGNQCVNCHMPQTTYMQRHGRHDHGFTIPDPLLTKEEKIPNACNRCHTDKNADWSLAAADKWYGAKMERPTRERARWIAKARGGDETARAPILRQLEEEKQPFWQAVAAAVLGQWVGSSEVPPALIAALEHADALVRENAARSLEPLAQQQRDPIVRQALERRLNDSARSVRVRAAWALRDAINPESPAGRDLLIYLNQGADQPGGAMQQGIYHLARNELEPAVDYFKKAVNWDPNSAPFRDSLAVALSMQGKTSEAIEQLEWAAKLDPRDAEYPYKLALAYSESGQLGKTIDLLQQALNLNPRHPRAAYNLGLAFSQANQPEQAIAALKRAEATSPNDPQIPYARATVHARLGQKAEAREAAQRALLLDPTYADAARLLQSLGP